ncbi:hypothetical protein Tco_0614962 [Tanacetum coccineum]
MKEEGRYVRTPQNEQKELSKEATEMKERRNDRNVFRCGDPNHLIKECPKPPKDKNQKTFVGGSWSDIGKEDDEKAKDKTCLVAQASNEICLGVDLEPDEWIKDSGCSKHMTNNRKLFSTYKAYNGEMLKKFGLEDSKPMKTSMSSDTKLTKGEECESTDSTKYRGMIEDPKTSHLEAVKRIFRYIKGTTHLGLWYPKGTVIETVVYADSDHAGDYVDRKSTSGICTFMGCCLTSWFSKKQTTLAISTIEAEYVSARKACQQALWMKQALIDYDI